MKGLEDNNSSIDDKTTESISTKFVKINDARSSVISKQGTKE